MTNSCFCYIRGEYEFTVLLLLSGAIKYIHLKQQRKTSHVEYKDTYFCPGLQFAYENCDVDFTIVRT